MNKIRKREHFFKFLNISWIFEQIWKREHFLNWWTKNLKNGTFHDIPNKNLKPWTFFELLNKKFKMEYFMKWRTKKWKHEHFMKFMNIFWISDQILEPRTFLKILNIFYTFNTFPNLELFFIEEHFLEFPDIFLNSN